MHNLRYRSEAVLGRGLIVPLLCLLILANASHAACPPGCTSIAPCGTPGPFPECVDPCVSCVDYGCGQSGGICACPKEDGDSCNDHDICTQYDKCYGGSCQGTECAEYDPEFPCFSFSCPLDQGSDCHGVPRAAGTPCDRSSWCPAPGVCNGWSAFCQIDTAALPRCPDPCSPCNESADACVPIICEDDGNDCTTDTCQVINSPAPPHAVCHVVTPGVPCNDGNACTHNEHCSTLATCGGGSGADCDDESECTQDSCDWQSGCVHTYLCGDDNNECTDESCDPENGCVRTNNSNGCSDGNFCTINDHCLNGACLDSDPRICPDANNADGDICNGREICDEGEDACVRVEVLGCNDADGCTDDGCHPVTGCFHSCFDFPDRWKMPEGDDRTFVADVQHVVQESSYSFPIDVTRYAGPTNGYPGLGYLDGVDILLEKELIGAQAYLEITAFGASEPCDFVWFNGFPIDVWEGNSSGCLENAGCSWTKSSFEIPIDKVRFPPEPGSNGNAPTISGRNDIRIDFANTPNRPCTKISGAVLEIRLMSPVVLVHGVNSNGGIFGRQQFVNGLWPNRVVWDNSIQLC